MINTVGTVLLLLASTICAFYALIFPSWFQQKYQRDGNDVTQGFGLFSFRSTGALKTPFYASITTLQYSSFCDSNITPNYMLGDGDSFRSVLCGTSLRACQAVAATGIALTMLALCASIAAVYLPKAGVCERIISGSTLAASILLALALVIWGWMVQQNLYNVDSITSAYSMCNADKRQWSCWFYGSAFWSCLAAVIILSVAGYVSSAGRAEKIRYFRKQYEREIASGLQASVTHDTASQRQVIGNPASNFVRMHSGSAGSFIAQPMQPSIYQPSKSTYPGLSAPPYASLTTPTNSLPQEFSDMTEAYPTRKDERQNHSLIQPEPRGGVV